jgi:hypothetical protein
MEKYVLQHRKNLYCNISKSSTATSQKSTMKHENGNNSKSRFSAAIFEKGNFKN